MLYIHIQKTETCTKNILVYIHILQKTGICSIYKYTYLHGLYFLDKLFLEGRPIGGTPAIQVAFAQILPVPSIPMAPLWKSKARSEGSENENPGPPPGRWKNRPKVGGPGVVGLPVWPNTSRYLLVKLRWRKSKKGLFSMKKNSKITILQWET